MRWWVRLALFALGAAIMAWEGSIIPSPGLGFAVALILFLIAGFSGAEVEWWQGYWGDEE